MLLLVSLCFSKCDIKNQPCRLISLHQRSSCHFTCTLDLVVYCCRLTVVTLVYVHDITEKKLTNSCLKYSADKSFRAINIVYCNNYFHQW